jgi:hypothetical protein
MRMIPGLRQDHTGRVYQYGREDDGRIVEVEQVPHISPEVQRLMTPVTATSLGYAAALSLVAESHEQQERLNAVLACGPTYQSVQFFQGS